MELTKTKSRFSLDNISVDYSSINALSDVSVHFNSGEIHTLIGEHGAGKSTLAKVIAGRVHPSRGEIHIDSSRYPFLTPDLAQKHKIAMVHQHNPFFEDLTVEDYFYLNHPNMKPVMLHAKKLHQNIVEIFASINVEIDPLTPLKELKLSDKTLIDILKNVDGSPDVLILDESLEKLTIENFSKITTFLTSLRKRGASVIIITHKIDYIYDLSDCVSILREGRILATKKTAQIDKIDLIQMAYTNRTGEGLYESNFVRLFKYDEAILKKLPINLFVVDNDKRIRIINDSVKTLFGISTRNLVDKNIEAVFQEDIELVRLINRSFRERKSMPRYSVPLQINNQQLIGKVNTLPVFDGDAFIGMIIIIEDITREEQLKQQLQLSQNLASVGLLAAGVAHEINNPLEIMNYNLEELKYNVENPGNLENIRNISDEIRSISDITSNLITFSETRENKNESFDFVFLITKLLSLIEVSARRQKIAVDFTTDFLELMVNANRTGMKQVVLNLIRNSVEAMPEGGKLKISLSLADNMESYYKLAVRDTGCGIEEKHLQEIFLPFFSTKKDNGENVGLGLSIIYGIIKSHQGYIYAKNLTEGCEISVLLPYEFYKLR